MKSRSLSRLCLVLVSAARPFASDRTRQSAHRRRQSKAVVPERPHRHHEERDSSRTTVTTTLGCGRVELPVGRTGSSQLSGFQDRDRTGVTLRVADEYSSASRSNPGPVTGGHLGGGVSTPVNLLGGDCQAS